MEELDQDECRRLLAERHLGRLAVPDFGGPVIFPVNYVFDQGLVVLRTDPGSKLDAATEREQVAFEVDAVEEATRTGWSVVVRGTLAEITDPATWPGCVPCPCTRGPRARRPATCASSRAGSPAAARAGAPPVSSRPTRPRTCPDSTAVTKSTIPSTATARRSASCSKVKVGFSSSPVPADLLEAAMTTPSSAIHSRCR